MIILSKQQHDYVISILNKNDNLRNRILGVASFVKEDYEYDMDDSLEIDFYDFLQDKQVE